MGTKDLFIMKRIHVSILDFKLFDDEEYYSRFHIWEDHRRLQYSDKFEIHVLELPKLEKYDYPETELLNGRGSLMLRIRRNWKWRRR